ncbi:winged helix-turn-helix domain-containing protein [Carnobacteriaceae bacterium 52-44]
MVRKKLDQVAYEYIVKQIESGQLLQREHITEQVVADELEISRTPVRKAFERLVSDNYLEMIKNVGVRVKAQALDSRGFQDRMNFIERLINHYLFDLEKNEWVFEITQLQKHIENMEETTKENGYEFENNELDYWCDLVEHSDNSYTKHSILKAMQDVLFDDGIIYEIMKNSRSLKNKHLTELMHHLEENNYVKARREIRILLNQLKLNVIENGHKYN